jgi:hypothetical protein
MNMLPTTHPRDLIGMRVVIIATCQHNALLGTLGMDPDAMTPLSWSRAIAALLKDGFQSTDFHTFPVSFLMEKHLYLYPRKAYKFLSLVYAIVSAHSSESFRKQGEVPRGAELLSLFALAGFFWQAVSHV